MTNNDFSALVLDAFTRGAIKKLVFSRPRRGEISKVSARIAKTKRGPVLALEYFLPGDTVSHKNLTQDMITGEINTLTEIYNQANLITTVANAEFKRSKSGSEVILGFDALRRKLAGDAPSFESAIEELDKKKNYILDGSEPFLIKLGISSENGRVHDKKQAKFRQINRFLEHIGEIYDKLPRDGELKIYDLCCGKSYLSFAVYHYLTAIKHREVYMYGADLKRDVILWCKELAGELGYTGMHFEVGDIRSLTYGKNADMVISLHACDIATDIVLETAVKLNASVILSTPCCHKNMRDNIDSKALEFVTRHSHIKGKLCEAITDALRLAKLEADGYNVSALELTDPDDTPKNTLLRAIRRGGFGEKERQALTEKYNEILGFLFPEGADSYLEKFKDTSNQTNNETD